MKVKTVDKKTKEFLNKVKINSDNKLEVISEYLGSNRPITYRCKICDFTKTLKRANDLSRDRKTSCLECSRRSNGRKKTIETKKEVIKKLKKFPSIIVGNFFRMKDKRKRLCVKLYCNKCEHNWIPNVSDINRSGNKWKGCPKCWNNSEEKAKKAVVYLSKSIEREKLKVKKRFFKYMDLRKDIKLIGKYISGTRKAEFKCMSCKNIWPAKPCSILERNSGCPNCNRGLTQSKNEFTNVVKLIHGGNIEVLDEYVNSREKIRFYCNICNKEFKARASSVKQGSGCPNCKMSKGERRIELFLSKHKYKFIKEWREHNCRNIDILPMDFYLPEHDTVIEFHGIQHREFTPLFHKTIEDLRSQQKRDKIKRDYCIANGIKFVEIWYNEFDSIEKILKDVLPNIKQKSKANLLLKTDYRK